MSGVRQTASCDAVAAASEVQGFWIWVLPLPSVAHQSSLPFSLSLSLPLSFSVHTWESFMYTRGRKRNGNLTEYPVAPAQRKKQAYTYDETTRARLCLLGTFLSMTWRMEILGFLHSN